MAIEPERIRALNQRTIANQSYVLYWMQASQRARHNPALEHAIARANELRLPLVVGFGLMDDYPEANARHYAFMLEGLAVVRAELEERGIRLVVRRGPPDRVALALARRAALVVCDRGYLRHQRAWRAAVATAAGVRVEQVEGDVVVPVEVASQKLEYAARTLRPKLQRRYGQFIRRRSSLELERDSLGLRITQDFDVRYPEQVLGSLAVDRSVPPVCRFRGGAIEGRRRLAGFLRSHLAGYSAGRAEPADFCVSLLAPYLHFGHVSPVEVALAVGRHRAASDQDREAFLDQLIVRRELAVNFVEHEPRYDRYRAVPAWARATLASHARDVRPARYSRAQLVRSETHDPHFNAAMREMVHTGAMHNSLRMYWAKRILEWSPTPASAFSTVLSLNNTYFLDGRDPNSYANVAWCFGLHDRPWPDRPIFGTVRFMNDRGLERKYDMKAYAEAVASLVAREQRRAA